MTEGMNPYREIAFEATQLIAALKMTNQVEISSQKYKSLFQHLIHICSLKCKYLQFFSFLYTYIYIFFFLREYL